MTGLGAGGRESVQCSVFSFQFSVFSGLWFVVGGLWLGVCGWGLAGMIATQLRLKDGSIRYCRLVTPYNRYDLPSG